MRIIVDQDEVICKFVDRILEYWNEDKHTSVMREDIKDWRMETTLGQGSEDFIRSMMRYQELMRDLQPVEGAIYGMKKLIDSGHDVVIATAVPRCAGIVYNGKLEWLRRNMPWFDLKNFVAIHRKSLLQGDILLDDGPHNIQEWTASARPAVVFDAPWNKSCKAPHRVKHWNEFLKLVEQLSK